VIPAAFEYEKPDHIARAVALLVENGSDACVLAGGQTLLTRLKARTVTPRVIVDLAALDDLRVIERPDDAFTIGALVTQTEILESAELIRSVPIFQINAAMLGDPIVRNRGTLVGALAAAEPAGDWPAIALALDARLRTTSSAGSREIAADAFFAGACTTTLLPSELITHVTLPAPTSPRRMAYQSLRHPTSNYARVGVAAIVETPDGGQCIDCRVALTGLGPRAVRCTSVESALRGHDLTRETIIASADHACDDIGPNDEPSMSPEYRCRLARTYTARALLAAA
jgi:aerobic carbon-monoxide dehydrogenase medium subunit